MLDFARAYPVDRILAVFRANAGLDTRGARPPGGWETADGNLRGHFGGHFLTLVAQAYADTRVAALKAKLDELVAGLGECRRATADHGSPKPSHPNYLAAYSETQFIRLESCATYPAIWARRATVIGRQVLLLAVSLAFTAVLVLLAVGPWTMRAFGSEREVAEAGALLLSFSTVARARSFVCPASRRASYG
ncbi:beta-L-arabinofuranosidase domain-containing protein [Streptomyces sp. LUP30]|uniref:beta-L-arabinofuranosidase domain-containing protein n=1 Tax=Streptomyces sp. LUP30 TaxID=1890285 RepID=UPI0008517CB9